MDYSEYAANMDLGQAFLEVMARAAEEGFGFVAQELEVWRTQAASQTAAEAPGAGGSGSGSGSAALSALEEKYGLKFRADGGGSSSSSEGRKRAGKAGSKGTSHKLTMAEKVGYHTSGSFWLLLHRGKPLP
jgi:hypothetical protein